MCVHAPHTPGGSCVDGEEGLGMATFLQHLRSANQEAENPVAPVELSPRSSSFVTSLMMIVLNTVIHKEHFNIRVDEMVCGVIHGSVVAVR